MNNETALDKYNRLIKTAQGLESMASDDATGGPTYWSNMRECTGIAIADSLGRLPERMTWRLGTDAMWAIYSVSSPHLAAIWKDAAALLRERAAKMKSDLEAQQGKLAETIALLASEGDNK